MARKKKPAPFVKPTDVKQWWLAPHCGPGSIDPKDDCGFCGRNVLECAKDCTEVIHRRHLQPGDGDICDEGCGGSGFWCRQCGRFWAQDSCGESNGSDHRAADGAKLEFRLAEGEQWFGQVHCVCGARLMDDGEREFEGPDDPRRPPAEALKKDGYALTGTGGGEAAYEKVCPGDRVVVSVDLNRDGRHSASHWKFTGEDPADRRSYGRMNTMPSRFTSVEGMWKAVSFERNRDAWELNADVGRNFE